MSYTSKVKEEILINTANVLDIQKYAELRAIFLLKNCIENGVEIRLENKEIAERVYKNLKDVSTLKIAIKYSKSKKFGEHNIYIISIPQQPGLNNFLKLLENFSAKENNAEEETVRGFVRGMFLGCGYIKSPEREYALDFFVDGENLAEELYNVLFNMGKKVYKTLKRNKTLVYMRNAEDIMDVIVYIGALKEFYSYEETTMIKDLKNKTIREMNWEVANETKTLDTARKQIDKINYIGKKIGLNELSPVLEEVAFLRLQHQEASLQELAELIGISKSGIRNRFRRIEEIYNELKEKERE